ncbi:MAG: type II toxin-antitoxin system death-on-curing family toxin [Chloroflexales bacterium]|nr:type II toxin-antitoxin system death-on-curing family toxin [Chloroflexales bacterium]
MNYLTKEDLLDLHTYAVLRYGGLLGIASQDRLQAVLNAPRQEMFGTELYPDLCSKAAIITYLLIKNRPFVGGNEITALMALLRFLEINGTTLRYDVGSSELAWLIRAVTHSDMDKEGLENWLRDSLETQNRPLLTDGM